MLQQRRGTADPSQVEPVHHAAEGEAASAGAAAVSGQAVSVHSIATGLPQLDAKDDDDPVLRAYMEEQKKKANPQIGSAEWIRRFKGQPEKPEPPPKPADDSHSHTPPSKRDAPARTPIRFSDSQISTLRAWAETPAVDPPRTNPPTTGGDSTKVTALIGIIVDFGMMELKYKISSIIPARFFEFGQARRGFVAGMTGAPLTPPTDERDLKEWNRGEDMAGVVFAAEAIAGGIPPPGGGGPLRTPAPAGGARVHPGMPSGPGIAPGLLAEPLKPKPTPTEQTKPKEPAKSTEPPEPTNPKEPPKRAPEPEPVQKPPPAPASPQQGVRDALVRTNQKIAEAQADLAAFAKERGPAGEEVARLHKKATDTPSTDPEHSRVVKELKAAQDRLAELNGTYESKVGERRQLEATRDRLKAALDAKTYDRPPAFTEAERATVWKAAKSVDGKVFSPSSKEIKPGDPWIMGHKPKYEFRKHVISAAERGISREQFLKECRQLDNYRPETYEDSSSHLYEDHTDAYLGP